MCLIENKNLPVVSIVLPAYNSAKFIRETIGSVLLQTYKNWELIVVDDGSVDNTVQLISGVDDRIHIIRQENAGIAAARNTGIKNAIGDFVAFLDHDDYWHPSKLISQLEVFAQNPDVGVVYGEFIRWDADEPPVFRNERINHALYDPAHSGWIYHVLLQTNWVLFSTVMFRREVFEVVGLFDCSLPPADDWDMAIRTSLAFKFIKLADPVALYRVHSSQTSRRKEIKNHEADFREMTLAKYGTRGRGDGSVDMEQFVDRQFKAHFNHGLMHIEGGDVHIARKSFIKAIELKPLSPKVWLKYFLSLFS